MVYRGPSHGCGNCRKRRVKCDEQRPHCGNCIKRKLPCPGYRTDLPAKRDDRTGKEDSISLRSKEDSISLRSDDDSPDGLFSDELYPNVSASDSTALIKNVPLSIEPTALGYFYSQFIAIPKDPTTNIYLNHIMPLTMNAPVGSALSHAVSASALNVAGAWTYQGWDGNAARQEYSKSVTLLKQELQDSSKVGADEVLAAAFMLDFYEMLSRRWNGKNDVGLHASGAMAMVKHRGIQNFKTESSRRLFAALRNRYISYALQHKMRIPIEAGLFDEDITEFPSAKLDLLLVNFANLQCDVVDKLIEMSQSSTSTNPFQNTFHKLLQRTLTLEARLKTWRETLPQWWHPYIVVDVTKEIHPSIRSAGMYQDRCSIYSSLASAHAFNIYRAHHISLLRILKCCSHQVRQVSPFSNFLNVDEYVETQSQCLADEICASVPFFIGSRTTAAFPHEHHEYPKMPEHLQQQTRFTDGLGDDVQMKPEDHMHAAASYGGWFIMIVLVQLMSGIRFDPTKPDALPATILRPGQSEWIGSQLYRLTEIYQFHLPPSFLNKVRSQTNSQVTSPTSFSTTTTTTTPSPSPI